MSRKGIKSRTGLDGCPYSTNCCGKPSVHNLVEDTEAGPDNPTVLVWSRRLKENVPVAKGSAEACPYQVHLTKMGRRKAPLGQPNG